MNLQQLQTNLCSLIKSRTILPSETNDYVGKINSSQNLLLIRKIALWWRKIQVENYCLLTGNLLKITGKFEIELSNFFREQKYSAFREEVCIQFLKYLISKNTDSLTQSVAGFELSVIMLKLGENVESMIMWEYEPYATINGLLRNTLSIEKLEKGIYNVEISYMNKEELFTVKNMSEPINN